MLNGQLDIVDEIRAADIRRRIGMERAERSAGDDWLREVVPLIGLYARNVAPGTFLTEQAREAITKAGFRKPPNPKSWGPAMKLAEQAGLVAIAGYGAALSSNQSPKRLWRAI